MISSLPLYRPSPARRQLDALLWKALVAAKRFPTRTIFEYCFALLFVTWLFALFDGTTLVHWTPIAEVGKNRRYLLSGGRHLNVNGQSRQQYFSKKVGEQTLCGLCSKVRPLGVVGVVGPEFRMGLEGYLPEEVPAEAGGAKTARRLVRRELDHDAAQQQKSESSFVDVGTPKIAGADLLAAVKRVRCEENGGARPLPARLYPDLTAFRTADRLQPHCGGVVFAGPESVGVLGEIRNNFRVEDAEGNNLFVDTRQWPPGCSPTGGSVFFFWSALSGI